MTIGREIHAEMRENFCSGASIQSFSCALRQSPDLPLQARMMHISIMFNSADGHTTKEYHFNHYSYTITEILIECFFFLLF